MGGFMSISASGGNLGHIELFNNDKTGQFLYPYAVSTSADTLTQMLLEVYQGQKATTLGAFGTDFAALLTAGPQLSGILGTFYTSSCVGAHIGQAPGITGATNIAYPFPFAAVAPGYSFCIECQSAGVRILGGVWWMVDGAP